MSQFGEDDVLKAYFAEKGVQKGELVDVGAYAKEFSNSWSLLKDGWSGVLVDATPMNIQGILDDFEGLDARVVCAAVGTRLVITPLHLHEHTGHNSLLGDWHPVNKMGREVLMYTVPLDTLLGQLRVRVDFELLSIDTEGMDFDILRVLFFDGKFKPGVVVTERISHQKSDDLFGKNGYEFMGITGPEDNPYGNGFYTRLGMPSDALYETTNLRRPS